MSKYVAFNPENEVLGAAMLGFIDCVNKDRIYPFLEKHGLTQIDPQTWYPLQRWLDVLGDISEQSGGGAMFDFVAVGLRIIETAKFPPAFADLTFEQAVMAIDNLYQANMRGGDFGNYVVDKDNGNHFKVTARIPYPDDMGYGQLYGMARRFLPEGTSFVVKYDDDIPRREKGGESTIMHVMWE
jgi:hypothetical protein